MNQSYTLSTIRLISVVVQLLNRRLGRTLISLTRRSCGEYPLSNHYKERKYHVSSTISNDRHNHNHWRLWKYFFLIILSIFYINMNTSLLYCHRTSWPAILFKTRGVFHFTINSIFEFVSGMFRFTILVYTWHLVDCWRLIGRLRNC